MNIPDKDTFEFSDIELCRRIETLTTNMMAFWKSSHGWASIEVAGLLSASMLEWQASLSSSLHRWLFSTSDGDLILAWTNLGALVEGQLKLFLSIYYDDYREDIDAIKDKRGRLKDPDHLTLEPLRQFFVKRIWTVGRNWNPYVERLQKCRNSIHAFSSRDIGTFSSWKEELRTHLSFIRDINSQVPYPDMIYEPKEY